MPITAKELSELLHLSPAAISMALNNKPGVSTATRKKVLETAKEYGYDFTRIEEVAQKNTPHGTIQFIIYKKCGAIVSDTPFFSQLSEGITQGCTNSSYLVNIRYIYDHTGVDTLLNDCMHSNCSGIILLGTEMEQSDFKHISTLKIPLVVLDTYFDTADCNFVLINNHQGAFIATNYLIKHCNTQPGYLRSSYSIANFAERANGFYRAIRANGMSTSKSIVHSLTPSMEGAYADMCSLLDHNEEIASCYFADNDLIACGAIKAFKERGYKIPEDISIIGFDNLPMSNYIDPPLTTLQVPIQYMGETAVHRLIELINAPTSSCSKIELRTQLIVRNSVKALL